MGRHQTDPIFVGHVRALLDLKWSERMIIQELKKKNIVVSKGTINRIKKMHQKTSPKKENQDQNYNRFSSLNRNKMKRLKKMVENPNQPTQRHIGKVLGCTQQNISHHIHKHWKWRPKRRVWFMDWLPKILKSVGDDLWPYTICWTTRRGRILSLQTRLGFICPIVTGNVGSITSFHRTWGQS